MSPAADITAATANTDTNVEADLVDDEDDLLIEEISIDGMCGVY
jgi:mycofactocin precursor